MHKCHFPLDVLLKWKIYPPHSRESENSQSGNRSRILLYFRRDRYRVAINGSALQISSKRHYRFRERASAIASPSAVCAIHYLIDCFRGDRLIFTADWFAPSRYHYVLCMIDFRISMHLLHIVRARSHISKSNCNGDSKQKRRVNFSWIRALNVPS